MASDFLLQSMIKSPLVTKSTLSICWEYDLCKEDMHTVLLTTPPIPSLYLYFSAKSNVATASFSWEILFGTLGLWQHRIGVSVFQVLSKIY